MDGSLHTVVEAACCKLKDDEPSQRAEAIVLALLEHVAVAAQPEAATTEPKKKRKARTPRPDKTSVARTGKPASRIAA
jgi:hypothetical protein